MKSIYLDYASTTPIDKTVANRMSSYLYNDNFGNPASNIHSFGLKAKEAVERSRTKIANIIGATEKEIIFTSGATESDNLAIKGVAFSNQNKNKHIITSSIEHRAIIDTCLFLKTQGFKVTFISPDNKGQITQKKIKKAIRDDTILISLMAVNNELGTFYPISEIGALAREKNIIFHVDAAQGVGKILIDVNTMKIDLLSISAHKIYGPKGIGALYIRRKPKIKVTPLIHGGGHESGARSGTLATHQIIGLGDACQLMIENREKFYRHIKQLRSNFIEQMKKLPRIIINTPLDNSYPGIINITFEGIDGETLITLLDNLSVSMGSACASSSPEPSHVLIAIGLSPTQAHSSLRFSFGKDTTFKEISIASKKIINAVNKLRKLSPQWKKSFNV